MKYSNVFETMYRSASCALSAKEFLKFFNLICQGLLTEEHISYLAQVVADGSESIDFEWSAYEDEDGMELDFSWLEEKHELCRYRGQLCRRYERHSVMYSLKPSEDEDKAFEYGVSEDAYYSVYVTVDEEE